MARTIIERSGPHEPLPEGFMWMPVPLTKKEAEQFHDNGILTGEGTAYAAIRLTLGLPELPYGLKAALDREGKR